MSSGLSRICRRSVSSWKLLLGAGGTPRVVSAVVVVVSFHNKGGGGETDVVANSIQDGDDRPSTDLDASSDDDIITRCFDC